MPCTSAGAAGASHYVGRKRAPIGEHTIPALLLRSRPNGGDRLIRYGNTEEAVLGPQYSPRLLDYYKILEKIVHRQMFTFLQDNDILSKYQYGFLPEKSTHEAIFNVVKHMYSAINNSKLMGILFLDIAKAFNCVDHEILYRKMHDAGFSIRVINWFKSYLNRSQVMKYGDNISTKMSITTGIAQGTVLGPLVFIFYINDCVYKLSRVKISMFADDCVLYFTGNNWQNIHAIMQEDLDNFVSWTSNNRLRLNESKTQSMIVGSRAKILKIVNPTSFNIRGKNIKRVTQYNYLGILLDSELSLTPLYKNIEKRVIDKVYMLRKIRKYLNYKAALMIYKQTILPIFDYAGYLLLACNRDKKHDLQVIQNDVLRFCEKKKLEDHISIELLHKNGNLISLEQRRVKQLLAIMYKLAKNPDNIVVPARNTRRHDKKVFRVDNKIGTKYAKSPFYIGTKIWDKLPLNEQNVETMFEFKAFISNRYDTFVKNFMYKRQYYKPVYLSLVYMTKCIGLYYEVIYT